MTLIEYITDHLQKPFAWGSNDCIHFAVGWIEIATKKDYLSEFKPWDSARTALLAVERAGGLEFQFNKHLTPIDPNYAHDGCVTVVERTAYIFSGAHIVSVGEDGLVFKKRSEAKCAWRY